MAKNDKQKKIKHSELTAKLITDSLSENEEQLRMIVDVMPDFVSLKDGNGRWIAANQFALQLLELENIDYVGQKDSDLADLSPFYREGLLRSEQSDEEVWMARTTISIEKDCPMPDGTSMFFDVIKVPIFHPTGERKALVVIARDITDRIRAERYLKESEAKLKFTTQNMSDLISVVDINGLVTYASPSHLSTVGFSPEGTVIFDLIHPEDRAEVQLYFFDMIRTKTSQSVEYRYKHAKGDWVALESKGNPVADIDGEIEKVVIISRDITDRKAQIYYRNVRS